MAVAASSALVADTIVPLATFAEPFKLILVLFDLVAPLTTKHLQSQPATKSFDRADDGQL